MRVLVVLSQPPLPEGSAAGRCAIALLRGLRAAGHDVIALAADYGPQRHGTPPADLEVEIVEIAADSDWVARAKRLTSPRGRLGEGAFAARARELAAGVDVVHLEEVDAAAAAIAWPAPTLAHLHFLAAEDQDLRRFWQPRARDGIEFWRAERRVLARHDRLLVNSDDMARRLRGRSRHVGVAPLALDPAAYAPAAQLDVPVAGLIGSGAWPPTRQAIDRLIDDVWPRVHKAAPEAELRLAGRGVTGTDDPGSGVSWLGEVPEADAFLRGLGLLLYPVGRGTGTKVKVLEALALGVPVVTTPAGSEGIAANDGVLVAEDQATIAAHAARLLTDPDERRERGAAGHRAFLAGHTPEVVAAALAPMYDAAVRQAGVD